MKIPCKIMIYNDIEKKLHSHVDSIFVPADTDITDYFYDLYVDLDESGSVIFFSHCDDATVEQLSSLNPVEGFFHILAVIYTGSGYLPSTKNDFIQRVPDKSMRERIQSFLSTGLEVSNRLSVSTGIIEFQNTLINTTDIIPLLSGVCGILKGIGECILVFNFNDIYWVQSTETTFVLNRLTLWQDLTIENLKVKFDNILSVCAQNDRIYVLHDHGRDRYKTPVLSTYLHESAGEYRDSGNRVVSRDVLKHTNFELDLLLHFAGLPVTNLRIKSAENLLEKIVTVNSQEFLDTIICGRNELFILTRQKNNSFYHIYHSAPDRRIKNDAIVEFELSEKPESFVYLDFFDVFLVAAGTDIYLVDPGEKSVQPQNISQYFTHNGAGTELFGTVKKLFIVHVNKKPLLAVVQDDRMIISLMKNVQN